MRLIDAEKLKEQIDYYKCYEGSSFYDIIDETQTITIKDWLTEMPRYVKSAMLEALTQKGNWINNKTFRVNNSIRYIGNCSLCGYMQIDIMWGKYCPNCGAIMKGDNNMLTREELEKIKEEKKLDNVSVEEMEKILKLNEGVRDLTINYCISVLRYIRENYPDLDEMAAFTSTIQEDPEQALYLYIESIKHYFDFPV